MSAVHAMLILDCTACQDKSRVGDSNRTPDGTLEWTAEFRAVDGITHTGFGSRYEPVRPDDVNCPECGNPGRIWSY